MRRARIIKEGLYSEKYEKLKILQISYEILIKFSFKRDLTKLIDIMDILIICMKYFIFNANTNYLKIFISVYYDYIFS